MIHITTQHPRAGQLFDFVNDKSYYKGKFLTACLLRLPLPSVIIDARGNVEDWYIIKGEKMIMELKNHQKDFSRSVMRRIEETEIRTFYIEPGSDDEGVELFLSIHGGGSSIG